ncbi:MAG: outer membrane protein transport protein [Bacteroidota bacterium]
MRRIIYMITFFAILSWSAFAGGYQVGLHGQKQIGMGLVGTSLAWDASCMFYNPGALSFTAQKYSFAAGVSPIRSIVKFQKTWPSAYEAKTDNKLGTPFYFYGAARINKFMNFGVAVNTPYGNSLTWGKEWAGRYLITDLKLSAIFFQPTLSIKLNEFVGIGLGLVYATGDVELNKAIPVSGVDGDGQVSITGKTKAWGFNAGLFLKPVNKLSVGINFRSKIMMDVTDGDAKFVVPATLGTNFPASNKVSTSLPLPANLDFGMSYEFSDKLNVAFSINNVLWSVYDTLAFDFAKNTPALADSKGPRSYKNTVIYRIGAEYKTCSFFTLRVGGYFDPSPVNSQYLWAETPSLDNTGLTAGFSIMPVKKMSIDMSFLYIMGKEKSVTYAPDNFSGKYKASIYIPGFGLTFNF